LAEQRLKTGSDSDGTSGLCRRGIHEDRISSGAHPPPPPPPPPLPDFHTGMARNVMPLKERNMNAAEQVR